MNFESVNSKNNGERASQRRWQQVLDFGCRVEEQGTRAVGQVEAPVGPAFEVLP